MPPPPRPCPAAGEPPNKDRERNVNLVATHPPSGNLGFPRMVCNKARAYCVPGLSVYPLSRAHRLELVHDVWTDIMQFQAVPGPGPLTWDTPPFCDQESTILSYNSYSSYSRTRTRRRGRLRGNCYYYAFPPGDQFTNVYPLFLSLRLSLILLSIRPLSRRCCVCVSLSLIVYFFCNFCS